METMTSVESGLALYYFPQVAHKADLLQASKTKRRHPKKPCSNPPSENLVTTQSEMDVF